MKVVIIGAGFGGLSAAALLARDGFDVTVVEKNEQPGGRASIHKDKGFTFDMGPSWYLMPDVYENFFAEFGKKPDDVLEDLHRLDPAYRIFFGKTKVIDISADLEKNFELFDQLEENGAEKLRDYLAHAEKNYEDALQDLIYRDYHSIFDIFSWKMMKAGLKFSIFSSLDSFVRKRFDSDEARKILEYSIGFLGGAPTNTPAIYYIMNHIDLNMGVWFPEGGMGGVVDAVYKLAQSYGAKFKFNQPVTKIEVEDKYAKRVVTEKGTLEADIVISNADYAHSELDLLDKSHRTYSKKYWEKRVLAPSAMVAYVGVNKKVEKLAHHTLFLDEDWDKGFDVLFDPKKAAWPETPSYYVNVPSKSSKGFAPEGGETLFILIPLAPGLEDTEELRENFFNKIFSDLEEKLDEPLRDFVVTKRIFCINDFAERYNAYKGTALGLSHTMKQTAWWRPRHKSKKVKNLYYTGGYTHPGIGVPMTLISSQIVSKELKEKYLEE
jgi:phytoene desaturase